MSDGPTRDAGPTDAGVGEQCAGVNPEPGPGVQWENTPTQDAGLWIGPPAGPGELVFVSEAELAVDWVEWLDVTLSVMPVAGSIKDVFEAVTGNSILTGDDLGAMERVMAVVGALGVVGGAVSKASRMSAGADVARANADEAIEALEQADAVREASEGWARSDATLKFLDTLDEARAAIDAADEYGALGRIMSDLGEIDTVADWMELVSKVAQAVSPGEAPEDVEDASTEATPEPDGGPSTYDDGFSTQIGQPPDGADYSPAFSPAYSPAEPAPTTDGTYDDGVSTQIGDTPGESDSSDDVGYCPASDEPSDEGGGYSPAPDEPDPDSEGGALTADGDEPVPEDAGYSPAQR